MPLEMAGAAYAAWLANGDAARGGTVLLRAQELAVEVARERRVSGLGREMEWMVHATPVGGVRTVAA